MQRLLRGLRNFYQKGDLMLLFLCLLTTAYGCVIITSATDYMGSTRFLITQVGATGIGVLLYIFFSSVDVEIFAERRELLVGFNLFLMLLLIPFGISGNTGNRSWLDIPGLPFNIQPAEICKSSFVILLAKIMSMHQNKISSLKSVSHMGIHLAFMAGLIVVLSKDAGVALIFVGIFLVMAFVAGLKVWWFLAGGAAVAAVFPFVWSNIMQDYQKNRILMIFDESIDPNGLGIRYHTKQSLLSLTSGGLTGQGLFNGNRTQSGSLNAQHTDFIFSAIGEELGLGGCVFTLLLLGCIIVRCAYVGLKSPNYMNRLICVGMAATLMFQVIVNVGMCLGMAPVIGLPLPFVSYGGSSIVSLYMAMGIVSGIHARPWPPQHSRYIKPPY